MNYPVKATGTAGALFRRPLRASLDYADLDYKEHKGCLSSIFIVTLHSEQDRLKFNQIVEHFNSYTYEG